MSRTKVTATSRGARSAEARESLVIAMITIQKSQLGTENGPSGDSEPINAYVVKVTVESEVQLEIEAKSKDEAEAKAFQWRSYDYPWPFKANGYHEDENGEWVAEDYEINADIQACHVVAVTEIAKVVDRDTGETVPC